MNYEKSFYMPFPFFTYEILSDMRNYVSVHAAERYKDMLYNIFDWIDSVLSGNEYMSDYIDNRYLTAAHDYFIKIHNAAVSQIKFIDAVMCRYIITSINDYMRCNNVCR